MGASGMFTDEQKRLSKEFQRRRVYFVFFGLGFVITIGTLLEESDIFLHVLDDYILIAAAVIAILLIVMTRKKDGFDTLHKTNTYLTILAAVAVVGVIFAFTQEINDPADLANDPGQLFFLIALVINRFV